MTDKNQTKVPLSQTLYLQQLIDKGPARCASEVSKRRAIAILAPKLYELRSKGYGWRDVAAWLTENGLAVTVPALLRYLRAAEPLPRKASVRARDHAAKLRRHPHHQVGRCGDPQGEVDQDRYHHDACRSSRS